MRIALSSFWSWVIPSRLAAEIREAEERVASKRRIHDKVIAERDARADEVVTRLTNERRNNHYGPMLLKALKGGNQ